MKVESSNEPKVIILGSLKGFPREPLPPHVSVCHDRGEIEAAVSGQPRHATWISSSRAFTEMLLEKAVHAHASLKGSHLITLAPPRAESVPALLGLFHPAFGLVEGFRWLPREELIESLIREDAPDRFIGGSVDPKAKTLTLLRGNLEVTIAPFSLFAKAGDGTTPDFAKLALTDYGRTVTLGAYEAAADAVLYEMDPDYRRRLNRQRRESERTFGASLMRLRKQRRLKRSDFAPVSSKEIARIERNEVEKPHARTLQAIARRLGVGSEEIEAY